MNRIFQIARREFVTTAMTKAFIIGALVFPAVVALAIPLIITLSKQAEAPKVVGTVAVIDPSGLAVEGIRANLTPEAISARRPQAAAQMQEQAAQQIESGEQMTPEQAAEMVGRARSMSAKIPEIAVEGVANDADLEAQKRAVWEDGPEAQPASERRLALVVLDPDAIRRGEGSERFGTFELFHRPKMDDRIVDEIRDGVREAIREARYAAYGQDAAWLEALTTVERPRVIEVTAGGERASTSAFGMMLPFAFMVLLMMSVMIGSQYLLTTTIEEKSSRVVEVLLSAVSPMQLMTGKVLGQMMVGLVMLAVYGGLGVAALIAFALTNLIEPMSLVYLLVFFILEYIMLASLTAAVGAAVNELREAQSLQGPIIMLVMIPYILWLPLSMGPNALWAQILSFIPPISPFVMMIRVTSTDPPPMWQPLLAIGVNAVGCYVFLWLAAKVFRVGLLMYGKPPNLATLVKWVRMA